MAENDVFSEDQTTDTSPLDALVGDGRKFKTVEDLAKGKQEADAFIEQLKSEKQQVMEELEAVRGAAKEGATVKELLEELRRTKEDNSGDTQLTEDDLENKVKQILQGESAKATAARNREQGNKLVLDKFDGNVEAAKSFLAARAKELGTTPAKLAELSESSPKLFAKAIDVDLSTTGTSVSSLAGVNTARLNDGKRMDVDGVPTKAYFDHKKKEMGTAKFINNKALQRQYLDAAMKLGDRFYN